jgi:hypothetical protein
VQEKDSEAACAQIIRYVGNYQGDADPRAISFVCESIGQLTARQLRRAAYLSRITKEDKCIDEQTIFACLALMSFTQVEALAKAICSRKGRPPLATKGLKKQLKKGAWIHRRILKRRKHPSSAAELGPGSGPYEAALVDAIEKYGGSERSAARAYSAFKQRLDDGYLNERAKYVQTQSLDDEYRWRLSPSRLKATLKYVCHIFWHKNAA